MSFGKMALWSIETIVIIAIVFAVQVPLRKKRLPVLRALIFVLKLVMILGMALLLVAIESSFNYTHGDIFAILYVVFLGDVIASIVEYVIRRVKKPRDKNGGELYCSMGLLGVLSVVFCLIIIVYGALNYNRVVENKHVWKAAGVTQEHTFAFASDLHAGDPQSMNRLKEFCRQVNAADPEFVILGGDVTDELTSYDEMVAAYQVLSEIDAPVFFVYGNHDRQPSSPRCGGRTYSDEQLEQTILDAGISILSDEYVKVADDLILLGREDISMGSKRKAWSELTNPYEGEGALIVADHQPYDNEQLAIEKSVLQLSGHTHAGQLWPLQAFYRILGYQAYGEFPEPGTLLYVSAGESLWMIPLRTEEHCEWELITLMPE